MPASLRKGMSSGGRRGGSRRRGEGIRGWQAARAEPFRASRPREGSVLRARGGLCCQEIGSLFSPVTFSGWEFFWRETPSYRPRSAPLARGGGFSGPRLRSTSCHIIYFKSSRRQSTCRRHPARIHFLEGSTTICLTCTNTTSCLGMLLSNISRGGIIYLCVLQKTLLISVGEHPFSFFFHTRCRPLARSCDIDDGLDRID